MKTVGAKISGLIVALIVMTAALGTAALINVARMARDQQETATEAAGGLKQIGAVNGVVERFDLAMLKHVAAKTREDMVPLEAAMAAEREEMKRLAGQYASGQGRGGNREAFEKLHTLFDQVEGQWEPIQAISRGGDHGRAFPMFQKNIAPLFAEMRKIVHEETERADAYAEVCAANSASAAAAAKWWIWTMLLASIGLGAAGGFVIVRGISGTLRKSAAQLKDGAEQISSAAAQVASASQSLAQGSSEQAASLEETSASTEEITSMTKHNADNSSEAAQVMSAVDRNIQEGNRTLEQMVDSMQEIRSSSDRISKIIKVIDEIAFQTNILALNAAVEAARAGEAGMGFAVVADEVRNLAQRSAQAAKDTAGLIEESIAKSHEGSMRVQQVSDVIRTITESAAKVKMLVDEVNVGSQEQSRGIDGIARAIQQMSQVTQSNAASAEESASASEELSAQAMTMNQVVRELESLVRSDQSRPAARTPAVRVVHPPAAAVHARPKPQSVLMEAKSARTAIPFEDDFTEI